MHARSLKPCSDATRRRARKNRFLTAAASVRIPGATVPERTSKPRENGCTAARGRPGSRWARGNRRQSRLPPGPGVAAVGRGPGSRAGSPCCGSRGVITSSGPGASHQEDTAGSRSAVPTWPAGPACRPRRRGPATARKRRHRQDRRVADLPAVGAGLRHESGCRCIRKRVAGSLPHQPARRGRSRLLPCFSWTKQPPTRAGPAVEVLVAAPDGEIDVPVVQLQRHVAGRVGQVEADDAALPVGGGGDAVAGRSTGR